MKDTTRRDLLRASTLAGAGALGVAGAGTAVAAPEDDIVDLLFGSEGNEDDGGGCDVMVDPSGGGDATTIQEGVDTAGPDDIICIQPGVYEESVSIDTDGLSLIGTKRADNTVVESGSTTVDVTGADVQLLKLTVDGTAGTAVENGPRTSIRNCRILTDGTTGIDASTHLSAVQNEFVNQTRFDQQAIGIDATGVRGSTDSDTDGIFLASNSFTDYRHAVELVDCKEVAIQRNTFRRSWYSAIQVESLAGTPDVDLLFVDGNEFEDNANAVILYEEGDDGIIRAKKEVGDTVENGVVIQNNDFRDFFWGVLTSTRKVPEDIDDDGTEEDVEFPGMLDGGVVFANCNYWGRPTGPRARDNDLTVQTKGANWVIPNEVRDATPKQADWTVEDAVDYRPWRLEPPTIDDQVPDWVVPGWAVPSELESDCVGGFGTDEL